MSTTTTLLTLPFLAIVSFPLLITASITIFFSAVTLSLQVTVISIELCYALVTNLFAIPPSSNWSLLSFSVSGPNTPDRRRSSDYGFFHSPLIFRNQGRSSLDSHTGSSNPPLDTQDNQDILENRYTHRPKLQRNQSYSSGFLGLISGDEYRDFEGLGGWRCPRSYTKSPRHRSGNTTPSLTNSVSDEVDDIAWVSINSRLELPSKPPMLRHHSNSSYGDAPAEPYLPGRKSNRLAIPGAGAGVGVIDLTKRSKGERHHRRSATTSMLSGSGISPTTQVHFQQDSRHEPTAIHWKGDDALRSMSHTSLSDWAQRMGSMASPMGSAAGGYFTFRPRSPTSGGRTTTNNTPHEERKPARATATAQGAGAGAGKAHHVPSLGSR
ncbi:hypothetical protein BJX76DRAFT_73423 [Aspergillus varians]